MPAQEKKDEVWWDAFREREWRQDSSWRRWSLLPMASERGSSGRRCCISHLGATSTLAILIELVGFLPVPGRMGGEEAKGKCSAWAGLLDAPVLLKEQPRRADGLPSAGSPALGPVSVLRPPQPGSAEARPAASHPFWKRKNVPGRFAALLSAVRASVRSYPLPSTHRKFSLTECHP